MSESSCSTSSPSPTNWTRKLKQATFAIANLRGLGGLGCDQLEVGMPGLYGSKTASHDRGPTSTSANDQALWRQFFLMLLREEDGYAAKCKRVGS